LFCWVGSPTSSTITKPPAPLLWSHLSHSCYRRRYCRLRFQRRPCRRISAAGSALPEQSDFEHHWTKRRDPA